MNENGKSKREWVKTVAIIFLSVMLVLTFFSNTIRNWSLPEVSTQYVQSGSITAKIRGTGIIESGDPYEVSISESRKISSVNVRVGDTVQKGDILLYLEDVESEELAQAKQQLQMAKDAYDKAILEAGVTSSDISSANGNVSAATYRQQITTAQNNLKAAEEAAKPLQAKVKQIQQSIDDCTAQLTYEQNMDAQATERANIAANALENAESARDDAQTALTNAEAARDAKQAELAAANATLSGLQNPDPAAEAPTAEQIAAAQADVDRITGELATAETNVTNAQNTLTAASKAYDTAVANKAAADKAVKDRGANTISTNVQASKSNLELQLYGATKELAAAEAVIEECKAKIDELLSKIGNVSNLEALLDEIKKAQKVVDDLSTKTIGASVTAGVGGVINQINVVAGNTAGADTPLILIQPEGKGCTLGFSVTNEQAKRVSVGDRADLVNAWRYDDVTATLISIKPDKTEPGQKKYLTFNIEGSVMAGQSLSLSVGQKSENYDLIVPNSAIREDSNGKFILTVESKPSPLGNRYIATRSDVEVLASDERQSAVSGALYGWEYVIINSSKPVEAGQLVRLSEN